MATSRTWFGGTGDYTNPANWSPAGVPQPGDAAFIRSGTADVTGITVSGVNIALSGAGPSPATDATVGTLSLTNARLDSNLGIGQGFAFLHGVVDVNGFVQSTQTISVGSVHGAAQLDIDVARHSTFENDGTIRPGGFLNINAADQTSRFINNGTFGSALGRTFIGPHVSGRGTFTLAGDPQYGPDTLEFESSVGAGTTVNLTTLETTLQLDQPMQFHGEITFSTPNPSWDFHNPAFPQTQVIALPNTTVTSETFANHELRLFDMNRMVAHLDIAGDYSTANFAITARVGGGTDVTFVPSPTASAAVSLTEPANLTMLAPMLQTQPSAS